MHTRPRCNIGPAFAGTTHDGGDVSKGSGGVAWTSRHYVKLNIFCGIQVYIGSYVSSHPAATLAYKLGTRCATAEFHVVEH